jgi:hypothetical protein
MLIGNLGKDPDVQTLAGNIKSLFGNWFLACNRPILFHPALKFSPDRPHTTANFALPEIKFARFRLKIQFPNKL